MIRVFDFGFGWAEWISMAAGFGFQAFGSELTEVKREFARSRGVQVLEWDDIPGAEFDYVHADWVFEHLPEPRVTFEHLAKGVRNGGLLMISVPDCPNLKRRLKVNDWNAPRSSRNNMMPVHPMEHINCWLGNSLQRLGREFGLEPAKLHASQQRMVLFWGSPKEMTKALLRPLYHEWKNRREQNYFVKVE